VKKFHVVLSNAAYYQLVWILKFFELIDKFKHLLGFISFFKHNFNEIAQVILFMKAAYLMISKFFVCESSKNLEYNLFS